MGSTLSFDATLIENGDILQLIIRGNTVMETQYYLVYRETDEFVSDTELFQDENYIGLYGYRTEVH